MTPTADAHPDLRPESAVVALGRPRGAGDPLTTPIVATAAYRNDGDHNHYARSAVTETHRSLEEALGALDGGTATVFSSGMAAIAAVVESRPAGSVLVVPNAAYSGSLSIAAEQERLGRMTVRRIVVTALDGVADALQGADLLWLESVSNPLLEVADLPVLIDAAHAAGALVGVDATFSTPLGVRPLDLGADIVMHSATKYLAGHSDVLMGVLVTRSEDLTQVVVDRRTLGGAVPGALESFLALRGLRTLAVRFERACANAAVLAERLAAHPRVARVRFPGLPDDPGHATASRLHRGYGAMLGVEVDGGEDAADRVVRALRLITNSTSLGGVESLMERRAQHAVDAGFGTPPNLLRFSVGIEHVEDLWSDLQQALSRLNG